MLPPPESTSMLNTDSVDYDNNSENGDSELNIALERLAETKKDLEIMSEDRRRYRNELHHASNERKTLETTLHEAQLALRQRDAQLRNLQAEYARLEHENKEIRQLAEDRLKDVRSLELFMTKTDKWSGAQVVQIIKDLNMVLLQYSAAVSEECTTAAQEDIDSPHRSKAIERISGRLGIKLGDCLRKRCHHHDTTLLQIALQAGMCQNTHSALSSFSIGIPSRYDSFLSNIFHNMHARETQATASRWRALTHTHIRLLNPNLKAQTLEEIMTANLRTSANVMVAAGYGTVEEHLENLKNKFNSQLRHIAETTYEISLIIRESLMSTDFQLLFVESSRQFYEDMMEDNYSGIAPSEGTVLCTTELGARCVTNHGEDGKTDSNSSHIKKLIVLKPKVALESIIEILESETKL